MARYTAKLESLLEAFEVFHDLMMAMKMRKSIAFPGIPISSEDHVNEVNDQ